VYETYADTTVSIIDARGDQCDSRDHRPGLVVPTSPSRAAIPVRRQHGIELDQNQRPTSRQ
jgi:hypothetical protein